MQASTRRGDNEVLTELKRTRGIFVSVALFSGIINVLMLTGSLFMLQIYDRVLTSGSLPTLVALCVITMALYVYYGFLEFVRSRLLARIGRRIEERLRGRVFDAIMTHGLHKTPNIGTSPANDLASVRQFLSGPGPVAFLDMPWVPIYILVVSLVHWTIGAATIVAAILVYLIALWTEHATRQPVSDANVSTVKAALNLDEARRNSEAVHSLGMRAPLRERWANAQQSAMDHQTTASDVGGSLGSVSKVLRMIVQSGMLALGAYLVIQHEISPGSMIACSIIAGKALSPVDQAVATWQQFLGFRKALERLGKMLGSVPPEPVRMPLPKPAGFLEVEGLAIKAPASDKFLLQGITFKMEPGQGLGIIGPTGAGKSTLARALVGAMPVTIGKVRLDGATADQRDSDEHGRFLGYLPQDVQLFDGTVAENISRFSENAQPDDIVAAAKLANVHDLVMRLPGGYNTPLGEQGARLSAGQRQRLALARALYGEPPVLILDEPNSNLDAEGEAALAGAIKASLQRGAAVIVIAHRPSVLAGLDYVMVLNDGRIAGLGPRDEVLKKVMPGAGGLVTPAASTAQPAASAAQPSARPMAALPAPKAASTVQRPTPVVGVAAAAPKVLTASRAPRVTPMAPRNGEVKARPQAAPDSTVSKPSKTRLQNFSYQLRGSSDKIN